MQYIGPAREDALLAHSPIAVQCAQLPNKPNLLQHRVTLWVGYDLLFNSIAPSAFIPRGYLIARWWYLRTGLITAQAASSAFSRANSASLPMPLPESAPTLNSIRYRICG